MSTMPPVKRLFLFIKLFGKDGEAIFRILVGNYEDMGVPGDDAVESDGINGNSGLGFSQEVFVPPNPLFENAIFYLTDDVAINITNNHIIPSIKRASLLHLPPIFL